MPIISTIACAITNNWQAKVRNTLLKLKFCYDKTHEQAKWLSSSDQSWGKQKQHKQWRNLCFIKNKTHQPKI